MSKKTQDTKNKNSHAAAEEQYKLLEDKYKRALADYTNLEKRTQDQRSQFITMAQINIVEQFLPILDDLERAAMHINDSGLNLVIKRFLSVLEAESVLPFSPLEEEFDPTSMDCTDKVPGPENQVMNVELVGYKLKDAVIRPAKVHVGDGSSQSSN